MSKTLLSLIVMFGLLVGVGAVSAAGGFDQFGYNDSARIFNGPADGVDKVLDGKVWGSPTYANDRLVMKWNAEWDRGNDEGWTDPNGYQAWTDNEWNGKVKGGSGEIWHYKIAWDRGCADTGVPSGLATKGTAYCLWGPFAMLQSQGSVGGVHYWDVLLKPAGYGAY